MNFLIIALVSAALQLLAPWYVVAIIPFMVFTLRPATTVKAFWTGFLGIALVWLVYGYYLHFISKGAMSDRIAEIFTLPSGLLLLVLSALVGGLVGGFAGLSGFLIRQTFVKHPAAEV